jgi:hypothetical protein
MQNGNAIHEAHPDAAQAHPDADPDVQPEPNGEDQSEMVATVATVAVVGVAAVAFEAALLPGLVLGVAAVALPRYFPRMGEALNPLFRSTIRGAVKLGRKTKEMMAEAQEQVHDIVAEVHAEDSNAAAAPKTPGAAA